MAIPRTTQLMRALRSTSSATPPSLGAIDVRDFATGGDGTAGDPWVGWDTAITWASNTTYVFAAGYFAFGTTITLQTLTGVGLEGVAAATWLVWTGGASPMIFIDEADGDYGTFLNRICGISFDAGGAAIGIIRLRSAHKNFLSELTWFNFPTTGTTYGIKSESCVTPRFENITALNESGVNPDANTPTYHLWLTHRVDHTEWTNTIPIIDNCWFKGSKSHGIFIEYAISPVIIGGASERAGLNGSGYGIYINTGVESGEIHGTDVEACEHGGYFLGGNAWTLTSTTTFGEGTTVVVGGNQNVIIGGFTQEQVTITGNYNRFINFGMRSDLPAPIDYGVANAWTNATYNKMSTADVPTHRSTVSVGNTTVFPGDYAGYFGSGGHTFTLDYSGANWGGKEVEIVNYSAFDLTVAVTAGSLKISGSSAESSTKTLPAYRASRITFDGSYWMMRIF